MGLLDGIRSLFLPRGGKSPEERRQLIRLKCSYDVNCIVGNRSFPAKVIDIGLNGLRLEIPQRLRVGAVIYVQRPKPNSRFNNEHVMCSVRWCRKRRKSSQLEAGLKYGDTPGNMRRSWVRFLLKELGFDERAIYSRRKAIRADSRITGKMINDQGETIQGLVVNLGVGGALFESGKAFGPGNEVRLHLGPDKRLPALDLAATVISTRKSDDGHLSSLRFIGPERRQVKVLGDYVIKLLDDATD